jgi:transcriptional regulator NrdR family protein
MNPSLKRSVTQEAPKGLVCRTCGCRHFRVLYTRRAVGERLLRRRMCRHCGRRITTYEMGAGATLASF